MGTIANLQYNNLFFFVSDASDRAHTSYPFVLPGPKQLYIREEDAHEHHKTTIFTNKSIAISSNPSIPGMNTSRKQQRGHTCRSKFGWKPHGR